MDFGFRLSHGVDIIERIKRISTAIAATAVRVYLYKQKIGTFHATK